MHKIYSRPRIIIPKIKINKDYKKIQKVSKIILILIITFSTVKLILDAVLPIFDVLCQNRAKSIATIISNEQATFVMKKYSYEDLFVIEKDNNENIKMINSNVITINEITSDIAVNIQNEINSRGRDNIEIALGSFTGFKLLAGKGPGVKITISSIGNVETDLRSEFIEKGINQTLHRVYLQVACELSILTPFENITEKITNQILLFENIIIGNIPQTYYNLHGIDTDEKALDVVN